MNHETFIKRCLYLSQKGLGKVQPNPMVGCVIVHNNTIIGEGFHQGFGEPHAEVNAIASVEDKELLKDSTLYVSLEPCSHYGKTPPCSDLIIKHKIPRVVIATEDDFSLVAGKGIQKLKEAGIEVIENVLRPEARLMNRRFLTFHTKKRPYIMLKWAETIDGYMDKNREAGEKGINWITTPYTRQLVHRWRSEEDAILVGANTVLNDNPTLITHKYPGKHPIRIIFDPKDVVPENAAIFSDVGRTVIFTGNENKRGRKNYVVINQTDLMQPLFDWCLKENIQSIFVEGGAFTLKHFIKSGSWDEARALIGNDFFGGGVLAPKLGCSPTKHRELPGGDNLYVFYNNMEQL
jgi:diaminohydroxyphosphoribosylaminopyrimidine deaminase/5-amino-6-(5-phosphoribosylamino)uracil reductase